MSTAQPVTEQAAAVPERLSWEAFLAWETDVRAEWVDGEVQIMSPNTGTHQKIAGLFYMLLLRFLKLTDLGNVWAAPMLMRLPEKPSGREPDVLVLLGDHLDRYRETHVDGPADLVVEVISEESQARDRGDKFTEYETAGIGEYWLADPLRANVDVYRLDDKGRYQRATPDVDGRYHSGVLPGFTLDPAWLWRADDIDPGEVVAFVAAMLPSGA